MFALLCKIYTRFPFINRIRKKGKGNKIFWGNALLSRCKIICNGSNNQVFFRSGHFKSCKFVIQGNNNVVCIDDNVNARDLKLFVSQNGNCVKIGEGTTFAGSIYLGCMEGTSLTIGKGCLFSSDIQVRTSDSHSILNENGERINKSQDIFIDDRVWCGHRVSILKGTKLGVDTVVAAGSIVNREIESTGVIVAGIPAKIVKSNIHWCKEKK